MGEGHKLCQGSKQHLNPSLTCGEAQLTAGDHGFPLTPAPVAHSHPLLALTHLHRSFGSHFPLLPSPPNQSDSSITAICERKDRGHRHRYMQLRNTQMQTYVNMHIQTHKCMCIVCTCTRTYTQAQHQRTNLHTSPPQDHWKHRCGLQSSQRNTEGCSTHCHCTQHYQTTRGPLFEPCIL